MIKAIKQWLFSYKAKWLFAREVRRAIFAFVSMARSDKEASKLFDHSLCVDSGLFYEAKAALRARFPGAFIEIAEGVVTVARGDLIARVKV